MKILKGIVSLTIGIMVCAQTGFAAGVIIIQDPPEPVIHHPPIIRPRPRPQVRRMVTLPIDSQNISVSVVDQIATTKINQVFENNTDFRLEGKYIFPLPDDVVVSNFKLEINGKLVEGRVLDKNQASQIYESYVRRYIDPALLEYVGQKMFRAKIFPIEPHSKKEIELTYTQTMKKQGNEIAYVFPMRAEKLTKLPIKTLSVNVNIKSRKSGIKNIYSPTYQDNISIKRKDDNTANISFEENNITPTRDFLLYFGLSNKDIGMNLFTYKEKGDKDGFFLMLVSPKINISEKVQPKDIIFVLDTSGSMNGKKIEQAKKALSFCVNSLNKKDRFNIITFDSGVNPFKSGLVNYTGKNKEEAITFIEDIVARGGTNIDEALTSALYQIKESKNVKIIIFLTDGIPTVGKRNIKEIIKDVKKSNNDKNKTRIFVLGVGYDVNTHLLDIISGKNQGTSEYVEPNEDIEVKVSALYSKVSSPILTDLKLDLGEIKIKDIYPSPIPDLFKGSQLILTGRYIGKGNVAVKLSGKVRGREKTYTYEGKFEDINTKYSFLPKLWATRKVGYLMNEIRLYGNNPEIVSQIKDLGVKYGVVTPYTSYLVEDKTALAGMPKGQRQLMMMDTKEMRIDRGFRAVKMAKLSENFKKSASVNAKAESALSIQIRNINNRTFYLRNKIWVQGNYKDQKTINLKYFSKRYFKLVKKYPEIGKYLALGEQVIFRFKNKWYKIYAKKG